MIEIKLAAGLPSTVYLAVANVFQQLAGATAGEKIAEQVAAALPHPLPLSAAPVEITVTDDALYADGLGYDDADEDTQILPPPPTDGLAATVASLAAAGVDLDSDGYPWDHRIHASTKTKIANGTWKLKPKTDPALIEQVRGEFRQTAAAPIDVPPALQAPAPQLGAAVEPAPQAPAPAAAPAPQAPAAVATGDKPTNPAALFAATMKKYSIAETSGKVEQGAALKWCVAAGLPSVAGLMSRLDLCGAFYDQLTAMGV